MWSLISHTAAVCQSSSGSRKGGLIGTVADDVSPEILQILDTLRLDCRLLSVSNYNKSNALNCK